MANPLIAVVGFAFALFIPGFFLTLILFAEQKKLARILMSIMFSIMITVAIGIALGYNDQVASITGGISSSTAWTWELVIAGALGIGAAIKNRHFFSKKKINKATSPKQKEGTHEKTTAQ